MKKHGIMADPLTGRGDCIDMSRTSDEHGLPRPHVCSCQKNIFPLLDRIRVLEAAIVKNCELCKWRKCEQCPTKSVLDSIEELKNNNHVQPDPNKDRFAREQQYQRKHGRFGRVGGQKH